VILIPPAAKAVCTKPDDAARFGDQREKAG
jgi:hypothetical protein